MHGRAESCNLPWVGTCLLASVRFCGRHSAGVWWVPHVKLQEVVLLLSWPEIVFPPHHPKWGKVWSHVLLAVSPQTALAFPELLPRSSPVPPIKCTEELLGKQVVGTTLSHLVSTEKTSHLVGSFCVMNKGIAYWTSTQSPVELLCTAPRN